MKLIKSFIALSLVEGLLAILLFIFIAQGSLSNAFRGLTPARWLVVLAAAAGCLVLAILFIRSMLDARWFSSRVEHFLDRLTETKRWPLVLLSVFFAFVFLYALPLLAQMFFPNYRLLLLQLLPMTLWAWLVVLQVFIVLVRSYFQVFPEDWWSRDERPVLPRVALGLFIASLVVRGLLGVIVIQRGLPLEFDETGYQGLALHIEGIMDQVVGGERPSLALVDGAYGDGRWPLFHPFILALGMFVLGPYSSSSRIVMIILSALTTPLVYLVVKKVAKHEKIALYSGLIHIFYPTFLAYSHYLWSETTLLFLYFGMIYTLLLMFDTRKTARLFVLSAVCGLLLGLGALTRSSMLPLIVVVPIVIALHFKDRLWRYAAPSILLGVVAITTLPWIFTLTLREGELTLFGTNGGYTLYLSNNPWLTEQSYGSSMEFRSTRDTVRDSIERYRRANDLSDAAAASALARHEIAAHPFDFVLRSLERVRYFVSGDSFIVRHFVHAVYPPVSDGFIVSVWILFLLSYMLLLTLIAIGLAGKGSLVRRRGLFLTLALVGMVLPAVTIANSRYYMPTMATLVPFAGVGIFRVSHLGTRKKIVSLSAGLLISGALIVPTIQNYIQNNLRPSIYYMDLVAGIDRYFSGDPEYSDRFIFAKENGEADTIRIEILTDGYLFRWREAQSVEWDIPAGGGFIQLDIYAASRQAPLEISLTSLATGETIRLDPLDPATWHQWTRIGLGDIHFQWVGGGS